jgi:hypothetical protein
MQSASEVFQANMGSPKAADCETMTIQNQCCDDQSQQSESGGESAPGSHQRIVDVDGTPLRAYYFSNEDYILRNSA